MLATLRCQMGGCYASGTRSQKEAAALVDEGPYVRVLDTSLPEPDTASAEAISRVIKHKVRAQA